MTPHERIQKFINNCQPHMVTHHNNPFHYDHELLDFFSIGDVSSQFCYDLATRIFGVEDSFAAIFRPGSKYLSLDLANLNRTKNLHPLKGRLHVIDYDDWNAAYDRR